MGDFDYEELDKAIKDLYLTDDDSEQPADEGGSDVAKDENHSAEVQKADNEALAAPAHPTHRNVLASQSVHVASVSSNGATSIAAKTAKSIAITSDNEELIPVHKINAVPVAKPRRSIAVATSDDRPKPRKITIDRQDDLSQQSNLNPTKRIAIAGESSIADDAPRQIEHHTFRLQPRARAEVSGRNFRGNVSRRNDDIDVDVRTDEDLLPTSPKSNNAKPFTINKNNADMAQSRRRTVHYGSVRRPMGIAQPNPQRSLSQPLPKPVAFIPHVDIEADPEPKVDKVPYEVPFLPDAKVEKRPLGGGEKVEVPVDPAVVGASVHIDKSDVTKKSLPDLDLIADDDHNDKPNSNTDDVPRNTKADQIARDLLHNGSPDDDFIGEFLQDVKKRRHGKKAVIDDVEVERGDSVDIPVTEHLTEPKKSEPVIGAAVAKVVNNSNHKNIDVKPTIEHVKSSAPTSDTSDEPLQASTAESSRESNLNTTASRTANLNRYQTKYTPKRGSSSWGWILLFILALIGGTFVGVALYYYGL